MIEEFLLKLNFDKESDPIMILDIFHNLIHINISDELLNTLINQCGEIIKINYNNIHETLNEINNINKIQNNKSDFINFLSKIIFNESNKLESLKNIINRIKDLNDIDIKELLKNNSITPEEINPILQELALPDNDIFYKE